MSIYRISTSRSSQINGQDLLFVRSFTRATLAFGVVAEAVGAWEAAGESLAEFATRFDQGQDKCALDRVEQLYRAAVEATKQRLPGSVDYDFSLGWLLLQDRRNGRVQYGVSGRCGVERGGTWLEKPGDPLKGELGWFRTGDLVLAPQDTVSVVFSESTWGECATLSLSAE